MSALAALLLSILIEVPVVVLATRQRRLELLLVAVGATLVTHPFAWHGAQALLARDVPFVVVFVVVEVAVVAVEGALYAGAARLGWRRGLVVSFAANAVSAGVGLLIHAARLL